MIVFLSIVAIAAVALVSHLVYGAILASREYQRSEQVWADALDLVIPARPPRRHPVVPARLQRA